MTFSISPQHRDKINAGHNSFVFARPVTGHRFNLAAAEFVQRAAVNNQASFAEINMRPRFPAKAVQSSGQGGEAGACNHRA